jgi:hypothetical protein
MGREVKRVSLDFDWPLNKTWHGYLNPYNSCECPYCEGSGYSLGARELQNQWYGRSHFDPSMTGNSPWTSEDEDVIKRAKNNFKDREVSESTVHYEARRLAAHFNSCWSYNLDQEDVYNLCINNGLWDFTREFIPGSGWKKKFWETKGFWCPVGKESTPQTGAWFCFCNKHECEMELLEPDDVRLQVPSAIEVNRWSVGNIWGHDSINAFICIKAKCERLGIDPTCDRCKGEGTFWQSEQLKTLYENWVKIEPPTGEGWQVWETVSEGSPISPVFNSAESLVSWLEFEGYSRLAAENFVKSGWVSSGVFVNSKSKSGGHFYSDIESAVLQEQK